MVFADRAGDRIWLTCQWPLAERAAEPNRNWNFPAPLTRSPSAISTYKKDSRLLWGSAGVKVWQSIPRDHLSSILLAQLSPGPLVLPRRVAAPPWPAWLCRTHRALGGTAPAGSAQFEVPRGPQHWHGAQRQVNPSTSQYFCVFLSALNYAKPQPSPHALGSQWWGCERLNLQVSCDSLWRSNYSALTGTNFKFWGLKLWSNSNYVSGSSTLSHWEI